jgi:hypothetical protein
MIGFVYRWIHIPTERYYIGSHQGHTNDGYICSSQNIIDSIKADPEDWRRDILSMGDIEEMRQTEEQVLREVFEEPDCLNQAWGSGSKIVFKDVIRPKTQINRTAEVSKILELLGE